MDKIYSLNGIGFILATKTKVIDEQLGGSLYKGEGMGGFM
jgi:hypothetical protein